MRFSRRKCISLLTTAHDIWALLASLHQLATVTTSVFKTKSWNLLQLGDVTRKVRCFCAVSLKIVACATGDNFENPEAFLMVLSMKLDSH